MKDTEHIVIYLEDWRELQRMKQSAKDTFADVIHSLLNPQSKSKASKEKQ